MVFVTSGFRGNNLKAIRLAGASGDITGSGAIVWTLDRDTPYVPSPLLYDGILYFLKTNTASCRPSTPRPASRTIQLQRLEGAEVFSSPVGAAGRVYVTDRDGTTLVLKQGPTFEIAREERARRRLRRVAGARRTTRSTCAGYKYLYCIAE